MLNCTLQGRLSHMRRYNQHLFFNSYKETLHLFPLQTALCGITQVLVESAYVTLSLLILSILMSLNRGEVAGQSELHLHRLRRAAGDEGARNNRYQSQRIQKVFRMQRKQGTCKPPNKIPSSKNSSHYKLPSINNCGEVLLSQISDPQDCYSKTIESTQHIAHSPTPAVQSQGRRR